MTNPDYTHLALVGDRSGSMISIAADMNGGIKTLLEEQAALPGKILVDIVTFDDYVEEVATGVAPLDVTHPVIEPRGMTALLDAIGKTIVSLGERLAALPEEERPSRVIVAIVTDGGENASKEWRDADAVRELVQKQIDEFQWDFIFLGANIDSVSVSAGVGFAPNSSLNYDPTGAGAVFATRSASAYVSARRGGDDQSTLADIGAQQSN